MNENNGKVENLIFIYQNNMYKTDNQDFINFAKPQYTRKRWENIRKLGKNKMSDFPNILEYCSLGQKYHFWLQKLEKEADETPAFYWITINPPPNSIKNFKELDALLQIFLAYKYVEKIEYAIEQRSSFPIQKNELEDNEYKYEGIHAHILLVKSEKPSKVKTDLIRLFQRFRIKLPPWNKYTFQHFGKNLHLVYGDKRNYLRGDKGCKEKDEKVKIDAILREYEKLESLFTTI